MDDSSSSSNIVPYYVIRTEKEPIHAVCLGTLLSSIFHQKSESTPSSSNYNTISHISSSSNSFHIEKSVNDKKRNDLKPQFGLGNFPKTISAHTGSSGIFDSSDDDEDVKVEPFYPDDEILEGLEVVEGSKEDIPEMSATNSSSLPSIIANAQLVYVGGSLGTISLYESGSGRLLDRLEGAHGHFSVLNIEELRVDNNGTVVFASQGRDGYVRFWIVRMEMGRGKFPTLPALEVKHEKITISPYGSPVFVGGEGFCKGAWNKEDGIVATYSERGSIALWDFLPILSLSAQGTQSLSTKCIVCYEGDKYGMVMSLSLMRMEEEEMVLMVGTEDGSILAYSLVEVETISPNGTPMMALLYTLIATAKPFVSTPVWSFSFKNLNLILKLQSNEISSTSDVHLSTTSHHFNEKRWIGVCSSSEDEIISLAFSFNHDLSSFKIIHSFKAPHEGFQDVKMRDDGMVAIGGWDARIRIFLLNVINNPQHKKQSIEQKGDVNEDISLAFNFELQPLAILRHHSASVQSISISSIPHSNIIASSSNDHRIALWKVY
jgi:hypothetical protein